MIGFIKGRSGLIKLSPIILGLSFGVYMLWEGYKAKSNLNRKSEEATESIQNGFGLFNEKLQRSKESIYNAKEGFYDYVKATKNKFDERIEETSETIEKSVGVLNEKFKDQKRVSIMSKSD